MRWNTSKGYVRNVEASDYEFLYLMFNYPDVKKYCDVVQGSNLAIFCRRLTQDPRGTYIIENGFGRSVGFFLMIMAPVFNGMCNAFWFVYAIDPSYRRQGHATAALSFFASSNNTDMPLALLIHLDNTNSIKVAEKCGFRKMDVGVGTKADGSKAIGEGLWLRGF